MAKSKQRNKSKRRSYGSDDGRLPGYMYRPMALTPIMQPSSSSGLFPSYGRNVGSDSDSDVMDEEALAKLSYKPGSHDIVPSFDYDDELSGSEYTSQMEALYYLLKGNNILLCGQAGAGKSWVIDTFRKMAASFSARLNPAGRRFSIAMTASTGAAAALIFGKTIHSWSGIGINVDRFDPEKLDERGRRTWKRAMQRIRKTDCLIIDEVSMLPAYFLSNLDIACRLAKGRPDDVFGGMQVVLVGDFLQLPPVDKNETDSDGNPVDSSWCFNAVSKEGKPILSAAKFKCCYLDRSRRSGDMRLNDLLNGIRTENITKKSMNDLRSRFGINPDPHKTYTNLKTMNFAVDRFNEGQLARLRGESVDYPLRTSGPDSDKIKELIRDGKLHDVTLKVGAVVMLTSNSANQYYSNGSMGTVVDLRENDVDIRMNDGEVITVSRIQQKTEDVQQVVVKEDGGTVSIKEERELLASVWYMPVRLAWAITVHKSQGQTLDGAIIDMSKCFQKGLGYVALSRVRSLDDIIMRGDFDSMPEDALKVDPDAKAADESVRKHAKKMREGFLRNEERTAGLMTALNAAKTKASKASIEKEIGASVNSKELFKDDESCYQYVLKYRSKPDRSMKAFSFI